MRASQLAGSPDQGRAAARVLAEDGFADCLIERGIMIAHKRSACRRPVWSQALCAADRPCKGPQIAFWWLADSVCSKPRNADLGRASRVGSGTPSSPVREQRAI